MVNDTVVLNFDKTILQVKLTNKWSVQVRGWYGKLFVGDRCRPRIGRVTYPGRSNASGGRTDVCTGCVSIRPDERNASRKRTSDVPNVRRHGVRKRRHTRRNRQL